MGAITDTVELDRMILEGTLSLREMGARCDTSGQSVLNYICERGLHEEWLERRRRGDPMEEAIGILAGVLNSVIDRKREQAPENERWSWDMYVRYRDNISYSCLPAEDVIEFFNRYRLAEGSGTPVKILVDGLDISVSKAYCILESVGLPTPCRARSRA